MTDERNRKLRVSPFGPGEPECEAAMLEVLETMFFELPEDEASLLDTPPEEPIAATALFGGDMQGSLCVAAGPWAARRLAASFLGREDESTITEAEVRLVACEMANMVCGNALSRIEPHGSFRIATPEIGPPAGTERGWLTFPLEAGAIAMSLHVAEQKC